MNFWFVSQSAEPLPGIDEGQRPMRLGLIGKELILSGHTVTWWTSDFIHSTKRPRYGQYRKLSPQKGWEYHLIPSSGYQKNFSFARMIHNQNLAKSFIELAPKEPIPDLIMAPIPAPEISVAATNYGMSHKIPVVIDLRDLWPNAIEELFPRILQPAAHYLLMGMEREVRKSCRYARAITGMSSEFVDWGVRKAGRDRGEEDKIFRHGYPQWDVTLQEESEVAEQIIQKIQGKYVIVFVGTLGASVEFAPIIHSAEKLKKSNQDIAYIIVGDGPNFERWKNQSRRLDNILWTGRVGQKDIRQILRLSDVGLVPYRPTENLRLGIPNKIGEYLSAGLPILNGLQGCVASLVNKHGIGLNYQIDSPEDLTQTVREFQDSQRRNRQMALAAQILYNGEFKAEKVYREFADHLIDLAR